MRAVAMRIPLKELEDAEFVQVAEQYEPSYFLTKNGLKVSRVSVFGIVVRKYEGDNFTSIKLDDFTACIDALLFEDKRTLAEKIELGDAVKVIGRLRSGNNGIFISVEALRKLSFEEEMFKRLEILKCYRNYLKQAEKAEEARSFSSKEFEHEIEAVELKPKDVEFVSAIELNETEGAEQNDELRGDAGKSLSRDAGKEQEEGKVRDAKSAKHSTGKQNDSG